MRKFWLSLGVGIAALTLIFWLFWGLIFYILVALVVSSLLHPITDYVSEIEVFGLRVPRIIAVLFSFIVLALVPFLFVLLFVPLIADQVGVLQELDYNTVLSRLQSPIDGVEQFVLSNFPDNSRQAGFLKQELNHAFGKFRHRRF